jgi:hypothetical protein
MRQHWVQELVCLLGVPVGQQGHGLFEIGKQHRNLFAVAVEGAAAGEDLLAEMCGRVRKQGTFLGPDWHC